MPTDHDGLKTHWSDLVPGEIFSFISIHVNFLKYNTFTTTFTNVLLNYFLKIFFQIEMPPKTQASIRIFIRIVNVS